MSSKRSIGWMGLRRGHRAKPLEWVAERIILLVALSSILMAALLIVPAPLTLAGNANVCAPAPSCLRMNVTRCPVGIDVTGTLTWLPWIMLAHAFKAANEAMPMSRTSPGVFRMGQD